MRKSRFSNCFSRVLFWLHDMTEPIVFEWVTGWLYNLSWSYFAVSLIGFLSSQIRNTFVTNISDPLRDGWIVVRGILRIIIIASPFIVWKVTNDRLRVQSYHICISELVMLLIVHHFIFPCSQTPAWILMRIKQIMNVMNLS